MRGIVLDRASLDNGDLDFSQLLASLSHWTLNDGSKQDNTLALLANAEVVVTNKILLDEKLLDQCPDLKLICLTATGTNNVDLEAAKKNNIAVTNVTGYATTSVVEHVFALILSLTRRLPEQTAAVKRGDWSRNEHFCLLDYPPQSLDGSTIGIVGYGELGKAVANMAEQFGLQVLVAESLNPDHQGDQVARTSLRQLFSKSDIISLHCPLTADTENLISQQSLSLMKPSAILINTARGGLVDEQALLNALQQAKIYAAGLDVLRSEPPEGAHPLLEFEHPRLLITPHIAWASQQARQCLINEVAENIIAFQKGERRNRVI